MRNGIIVPFDEITDSVISIDSNHYETHSGDHFFFSTVKTLTSLATGNFILKVGAKEVHFVYVIDSDFAGFTYSSYKNPTYTAATGTTEVVLNNDSGSSTVSTSTLIYNPDGINTSGSTVYRTGNKGTAVNPAKSSGGSLIRSDEVILTANSTWLLQITNKASDNNPINIGFSWYEVLRKNR